MPRRRLHYGEQNRQGRSAQNRLSERTADGSESDCNLQTVETHGRGEEVRGLRAERGAPERRAEEHFVEEIAGLVLAERLLEYIGGDAALFDQTVAVCLGVVGLAGLVLITAAY